MSDFFEQLEANKQRRILLTPLFTPKEFLFIMLAIMVFLSGIYCYGHYTKNKENLAKLQSMCIQQNPNECKNINH